MDGWIKTYRKLKDKAWYKKSEYVHVWIHLILSANHKDKTVFINEEEITIKRGQLLTSRKAISEETGVQQMKIYRALTRFENEHQIEQQTTNKYTVITIVNYDLYQNCEQEIEQQMNNKRTTNEQQTDTNKNNKNEKNNIKKENIQKKKMVKPTLEEVQEYCKERNNKVNAEKFIDYYNSNGWKVGRNEMKDWKACVRNWERNDGSFSVKKQETEKPEWFDKQIETQKATKEEQQEIEELLKNFE